MNTYDYPWKRLSLPPMLTKMRSMLSHEEKQYLVWLTAEKFEGWGAIVDLGPWLGSSSAALAEGLKRRDRQERIFSFDLFRWERSYMERVAQEDLRDGDDFLPLFMREIGDYAVWVEPRRQDLMDYRWEGGPIEILFVDAAKSWELTNAIFRGFGSHLVPNRSRIVLQDFRWPTTHWLPLIFDSRPDLWKEVESTDGGTTVTFVPLKPLHGPAGVHTDYSEDAFPFEAADQILKNRMASETSENRHWFRWMLYRKYILDGSVEEALKIRQELLQDTSWPLAPDDCRSIEDVSPILVPKGWKAYEQQDYTMARTLAERCLVGSRERPAYAVGLLGMSLLQLGDLEGARHCIDEFVSGVPSFMPAKLYRAEVALAEGKYGEVEVDALEVLKEGRGDNSIIDWAISLLGRALDAEDRAEDAERILSGLPGSLRESSTFLAHLAQVQVKLGRKQAARENILKALELAPNHELASVLLASLGDEKGS